MNSSSVSETSRRSRRLRDGLWGAALAAAAAVLVATPPRAADATAPSISAPGGPPTTSSASSALFVDTFDGDDGLVTNEFAFRNADDPAAVVSPRWTVTSGSLFTRNGSGWSGVVDRDSPDAASAATTGSAVFRALPHVTVDGDVTVELDVLPIGLVDQDAADWDGFHVLVRVHSDHEFYSVSAMRRDGTIVIKRKDPGGPSNGGTYTTLSAATLPMSVGDWHHLTVETVDVSGGVRITLWVDRVPVLEAIDAGETGPPLTGPSGVSIRGDNLEFAIDNVSVAAGSR